ncbi:SCP-like extracellular protein [Colletotrichum truncatum]|uniref:SCP-like extracellular protein n=1 Tax=Colletotrichum truncatum TaxID=5467 RepID=A0ACC3YVP1_COLTU
MYSKTFLAAGVFGLATLGLVKAAPTGSDDIQALDIINQARHSIGQAPLVWSYALTDDALAWSEKMALDGKLQHAPVSERKGAGELLSLFRSKDKEDARATHTIRESVKEWLSTDAQQSSTNSFDTLSLRPCYTEQLLSPKATQIGCSRSFTINVTGSLWSSYTVCRVYADINPSALSRRQDMSTGPFTGAITFFNPALGSCGQHDTDSSFIVALSHIKMGSKSNDNELCGKKVIIHAEGTSVEVTVTDKCIGCAVNDIDVSPAVFSKLLGNLDRGRVDGITWEIAA